MIAEARVVRAAAAYLGFEMNVSSPGPACSIPLSPVISVSAEPFSRRKSRADAIAESFMLIELEMRLNRTPGAGEESSPSGVSLSSARRLLAFTPPEKLRLAHARGNCCYCTYKYKVVLCVNPPPLAVIMTLKLPVGVPVVTTKLTGVEAPPPGPGFVTTTGSCDIVASWLVVGEVII